jgi:hypothetical protein
LLARPGRLRLDGGSTSSVVIEVIGRWPHAEMNSRRTSRWTSSPLRCVGRAEFRPTTASRSQSSATAANVVWRRR